MAPKRVRLALFRKAAGYSQEGLAEVLGVERSTIVRWESGDTSPQPWSRPRLARALGVANSELTELLDETSEPDVPVPAFGLTKGRLTQLRCGAPPVHRAFFGVGPLDIALVGRCIRDRDDPVIASEDDTTAAHLAAEVERLDFPTERVIIDPREEWEPKGDAVVVCGPASGHIGHLLMSVDPVLCMALTDDARWMLVDRETGASFTSPLDEASPRRTDHAYLARHVRDSHTVVHIAGLHALGSVGAAHYLTHALPEDRSFSMAVSADFDGLTPRFTEVLVPPRVWE